MSEAQLDRVWEIMEDVAVCMVTTHAGGKMRSRPMHALPERDENVIYFVTDTRGAKDDEIASAPDVCLSFADIGDNTYLSITGAAGPQDPSVRVLRVVPEQAEYWDTRGNSITVALTLMAARMAERQPDLGENKNVRVR